MVWGCRLLLGFGFQTALRFACFRRCFLVQGEEEGGAAAVVVAAFVAVCRIDGFVQGAVGLVQAGEGGIGVGSKICSSQYFQVA